MKKLFFGAVAALLLVPAAAIEAHTVNATAALQGGEEVPALLTGAVGLAEVTIDTDTRVIMVNLRLFNLPTGTTAGHIHVGSRGVAGPVVVDFPIPAGRTGDLSLSFQVGAANLRPRPELGIVSIDDVIQAISAGGAYVNIHTSQNPAGEIRGQLAVRQ
jgi:hypothetical protein